ncbi:hypothetical protein UH38_18770 [Aliterella atlantica CENA595]|uniref:Uncharacterized protein n=1 Tax=Aliterella atlantica CENA595 TaxID=1618023 RepID=A0A0D8ZNG0_9CYAN|nr:hypothetical protein UH38_18770 [Aliterella atlantica CENA595]
MLVLLGRLVGCLGTCFNLKNHKYIKCLQAVSFLVFQQFNCAVKILFFTLTILLLLMYFMSQQFLRSKQQTFSSMPIFDLSFNI